MSRSFQTRSPSAPLVFFLGALAWVGCGGSDSVSEPLTTDGGSDSIAIDGATDAGADDGVDGGGGGDSGVDLGVDTAPPVAAIQHVVVVVQENHSFDNYFGRWCTAAVGSNPTCTSGPSCCERAPDTDPGGTSPRTLDDAANGDYDPNHTQPCELAEIDGGKMDHFTTGTSCADKRNFAIAPDATVSTYKAWATKYALADRYFQPLAGASSANDMYFAVARYVFTDNEYKPASNGKGCIAPTTPTKTYTGVKTIADLVIEAGHSFAFYAEGYKAMISTPFCPSPPSDCTGPSFGLSPCNYDCSDVPFEYYEQFLDNAKYMKDWDDFAKDVAAGTLPSLSFIKFTAYHNEHPGFGTKISNGIASVQKAVDAILGSTRYKEDTLVLVTWDEGGGYFDHVSPPKDSAIDGKPYGTRVPLLAIGKFAKTGYVSHVEMEHSSIVKFAEYLFLGGKTGQLGARDTVVHNIGSLLDETKTGVVIPSD